MDTVLRKDLWYPLSCDFVACNSSYYWKTYVADGLPKTGRGDGIAISG